MLQAYRLLAEEMYTKGWDYPLHLGVTEVHMLPGTPHVRLQSSTRRSCCCLNCTPVVLPLSRRALCTAAVPLSVSTDKGVGVHPCFRLHFVAIF